MRKSHEREERRSLFGRVDIWEHACLLYHNFEWQSAAETFQILEHIISDPKDKVMFALNRGLIEARLGDFHAAVSTFEQALALDPENPITHFLLGLVNVEFGDHAKGHAHFESSLEMLCQQDFDCRAVGLAFDLTTSAVRKNIENLGLIVGREAAGFEDYASRRLCLNSIPADIIFEAPSRTSKLSQSASSRSEGDWTCPQASDKRYSDVHSSQGRDNTASTTTSSTSAKARPAQSTEYPDQERTHDSLALFDKADAHEAAQGSNGLPAIANMPKTLAPRDPQAYHESTRELARFLRHAGPSSDKNVTVDRDYMLCLLQSNNIKPVASNLSEDDPKQLASESPASQPSPHDDLESLLDLYCGPTAKQALLFESTRSSASKEKASSQEQEKIVGAMNTLDSDNTVITSDKRILTQKDLLDVGSKTEINQDTATTTSRPRGITADQPLQSLKPRHLASETSQRWLRKEARPPWSQKFTAEEHTRQEAVNGSPRSGNSSSSNEKERSAPSTVSSMEIFKSGIKRKSIPLSRT